MGITCVWNLIFASFMSDVWSHVDAWGFRALMCKHAPSKFSMYYALNMTSFSGHSPQPEFQQWKNQRDFPGAMNRMNSLIDFHPTAEREPTQLGASANSAGAAAEMAASRKSAKYADLPTSYIFQPIALETLGPMNAWLSNSWMIWADFW